jgi:phage terminase small subunit
MATLTPKQNTFLQHHVKHGMNPTQSARLAGYADPKQSAFQLVHSPAMIARIRLEREKLFHTDLATIATDTLKQVMESEEAPASAKVSACRTVLEVCNLLGKHSQTTGANSKDLSSMTPEELESVINSLESSKASMAKVINEEEQATDIVKD